MAKKEIKKGAKSVSNTKNTTGNKPAVKKPAVNKPGSSKKVELENQLKTIIKNLDERQLDLLIKQAKAFPAANKPSVTPVSKDVKGQTSSKASVIEILPGENNTNFIVRIDTCRKFFTRDDFRKVVKICQGAEKEVEKTANLYRWFMKERKDFLIDNNIRESKDKKLVDFINLVKSKYTTK